MLPGIRISRTFSKSNAKGRLVGTFHRSGLFIVPATIAVERDITPGTQCCHTQAGKCYWPAMMTITEPIEIAIACQAADSVETDLRTRQKRRMRWAVGTASFS